VTGKAPIKACPARHAQCLPWQIIECARKRIEPTMDAAGVERVVGRWRWRRKRQ
jgi:hypothetical protein